MYLLSSNYSGIICPHYYKEVVNTLTDVKRRLINGTLLTLQYLLGQGRKKCVSAYSKKKIRVVREAKNAYCLKKKNWVVRET